MADPAAQLGGDDLELLEKANKTAARLKGEIAKVIVGQDATVQAILAGVFSQGHTLVIGVPGLAKTLLVKTVAEVLGWSFKRIQFTPDMMPADIIGMELLQEDAAAGQRSMKFVPGPLFAQMILADEINRTPPKTQSALLEAMQEYQVTSMGKAHPLPRPFLVFATQNPIEQEGTYPLPEAQLDRFMFSLWMDYPSAEEEVEVVMATTLDSEARVETVCSLDEINAIQHLVRRVPASRHVVQYAVSLARATRPQADLTTKYVSDYVSWGAGPRASQHMILGAKALAVMAGEPAVSAEHVRKIAPLVLRHRVLPNYSATGEGIDSAAIIHRIVKTVREPGSIGVQETAKKKSPVAALRGAGDGSGG
ncbi:MAG: MoxR family ATPase [Planctomycetota bacterium]|nr:MAG: MoxR family ATPase [Planctomycetota bacterium]REK30340.1 MAG: MoxR family ATPase [Planctomycetota bacterium]REK31509.1 MAG: MoxR family ATPase [Planctomycetota bacterium]